LPPHELDGEENALCRTKVTTIPESENQYGKHSRDTIKKWRTTIPKKWRI
jgi:hypothetical protein